MIEITIAAPSFNDDWFPSMGYPSYRTPGSSAFL
jgi:hypothetical protein